MAVGSIQTLLVCSATTDGSTVSPCPAGQGPTATTAYVVAPDSASYFEAAVGPYDFVNGAAFWSGAFIFTLTLYFSSTIYKSILKLVR